MPQADGIAKPKSTHTKGFNPIAAAALIDDIEQQILNHRKYKL